MNDDDDYEITSKQIVKFDIAYDKKDQGVYEYHDGKSQLVNTPWAYYLTGGNEDKIPLPTD
jgi:hypothetical protein